MSRSRLSPGIVPALLGGTEGAARFHRPAGPGAAGGIAPGPVGSH
jgi:hypothetical protein